MTKLDPIIAVRDVDASAAWYQKIFGFKRTHGGNEFAVLESEDNEIILCLHKWGRTSSPYNDESKHNRGKRLNPLLQDGSFGQNTAQCYRSR